MILPPTCFDAWGAKWSPENYVFSGGGVPAAQAGINCLGESTQALRSSRPQCRQRVLRRAFSVPHFEQVRYMARAKKWVRAALTTRMKISKAIWRNAPRMRVRVVRRGPWVPLPARKEDAQSLVVRFLGPKRCYYTLDGRDLRTTINLAAPLRDVRFAFTGGQPGE
jgi:hypothetical protein